MIEYFTKHYLDHSQGVNRYSNELLLRDQELYDARNVYSDGGAIYSRRGFRKNGGLFKTQINIKTGSAVLTKVADVCTITMPRNWEITPTAGESIVLADFVNSGNNGTFTVTSATTTTVVFTNSSGVAESIASTTVGISIIENIKTLFDYKNADGASYLLGVGSLGTMKAMLAPSQKLFSLEEGSSGANYESGKTYKVVITNVDYDGRESPLGEIISITTTGALDSIELSDIPDSPPNVFYKKIYRTLGNGGIFYDDTDWILNGTSTYSFAKSDADMTGGGAMPALDVFTTDTSWLEIRDYHGKIHQFDTTRKTNFVMHKDWAIAMNGVDRIKWRPPKKFGEIESEATAGNFLYCILTNETYLEHDYPIGMKIGIYTESTFSIPSITMVLDNEPELRRLKLRDSSVSSGDGIFSYGRALPFGVPYIDADSNTASIATGVGVNLDGDYTYRIACSNMNNSEGPDRSTKDYGDGTPGNERSPGDSDRVIATSDKIDLTDIPIAPMIRLSERNAGHNVTITNPGGSRMVITRSSNFEFLVRDPHSTGFGEELEISGSGLSTENCGKFKINGLFAEPTLTVIEVINPNVVAEGPIACDVAFVEKIDRVTFRKLYRTGGGGAQPHRELKRDTAPAGLDTGHSYYSLPDASITSSFSDDIADIDLGLSIYTYFDPERSPPIPVNDDPPRFRYATSKDNMLVAANLNFKELGLSQKDNGALCLMVFNYGEIEGAEFSRFTPIGFGIGDSTEAKGIGVLKDSVIGFTEKRAYAFENLLELDFGVAPKRELISGSSGCKDARSIQLVNGDDGTQSLIFLGNDGLYEVLESGIALPLGRIPVQKLKRVYDALLTGERGRLQDNMPSCVQESEHRYIISLKENSNSVNDLVIVYDYKNRSFWFWDNYDAVDMCYWEDKIIHCNGQRAYWEQNKKRETDYSDDGYAIEAYIETRPYHMEQPDQVKKWDKVNVYQAESNSDQILSIASKSNFGTARTNLDRGETGIPWGYTNRNLSVNAVELSVTYQTGTTWRYTRTGGAAFDFVVAGLITGDRIRMIDSSPFLNENSGDFVITDVAVTYFEVSNEWGYPEDTVILTAANQLIGYYPTSPADEMDGINTLFKNLVFTGTRDPFEVLLAPSSSKFLALRFESFLNNKKMSLAGWSIKYGFTNSRGNERGGND